MDGSVFFLEMSQTIGQAECPWLVELTSQCPFPITQLASAEELINRHKSLGGSKIAVVLYVCIENDGTSGVDSSLIQAPFERMNHVVSGLMQIVSKIRSHIPTCFISIFDPAFSELPRLRYKLFSAGTNQVAYTVSDLITPILENVIPAIGESMHHRSNTALFHPRGSSFNASSSIASTSSSVSISSRDNRYYCCPYCGMDHLSEDMLWKHMPAYHVNRVNDPPSSSPECPICKRSHRGPLIVSDIVMLCVCITLLY